MIPARQRFETRNRPVFQAHDGLVENSDLLALKRAAQFGLKRQPVCFASAHRRLEHFDTISADPLGVIHREFRVLEQFLGTLRLAIAQCDPHGGCQENLAVR